MSVKAFSSAGLTPAATRVIENPAFSATQMPDIAGILPTSACVSRITAASSVAMPGTKRDFTTEIFHRVSSAFSVASGWRPR